MVKTFNFFKGVIIDDTIVWKTASGRDVPIQWMTTHHIENVLRCIRGEGEMEIPEVYLGRTKMEWMYKFEEELYSRR
jgi:hypothetical protein